MIYDKEVAHKRYSFTTGEKLYFIMQHQTVTYVSNSQGTLKTLLECSSAFIHNTCITGHYNATVTVTTQLLTTLMLCVLIVHISGDTYSAMSTPNDRFYKIIPEYWFIKVSVVIILPLNNPLDYGIFSLKKLTHRR